MPEPELGAVYWSRDAQNFYQEGRIGVVPRLEAIEHLTVETTGDFVRLRDELGRLVPSLENLIPKSLQIPEIQNVLEGILTNRNPFTRLPDANSFYAALYTYADAEGKLRLNLVPGRVNRRFDEENLTSRMIAKALDDLKIEDVGDVGGYEAFAQSISSPFVFMVRE